MLRTRNTFPLCTALYPLALVPVLIIAGFAMHSAPIVWLFFGLSIVSHLGLALQILAIHISST